MSDGVGINDLPSFKDRFVTLQIDTSSDENAPDDYKEVTGKVIAVSDVALVIQGRSDIALVEIRDILEIEEVIKFTSKGALIVRELARASKESIMQHLLDRHGVPLDSLQGINASYAMSRHEQLHRDQRLGHVHGQKERGKPGRKPKTLDEVTNGNPVRVQGNEEPDGGTAHVRDS